METKEEYLEYAGWLPESIDDGPGVRSVLFVQGCRKNCRGCHNKAAQKRGEGTLVRVDELAAEIVANCPQRALTISGGEPLEQHDAVLALLHILRAKGFTLCLYTGWELSEVPQDIIDVLDYLKTGGFELSRKDSSLQYVGSSNQHFYEKDGNELVDVAISA